MNSVEVTNYFIQTVILLLNVLLLGKSNLATHFFALCFSSKHKPNPKVPIRKYTRKPSSHFGSRHSNIDWKVCQYPCLWLRHSRLCWFKIMNFSDCSAIRNSSQNSFMFDQLGEVGALCSSAQQSFSISFILTWLDASIDCFTLRRAGHIRYQSCLVSWRR